MRLRLRRRNNRLRSYFLTLEPRQRTNIFWFIKSSSVKLSGTGIGELDSNTKEMSEECSCGKGISGSGFDSVTKCQQEAFTKIVATFDVPPSFSRSVTTILVSFPFSALFWLGLLRIVSS